MPEPWFQDAIRKYTIGKTAVRALADEFATSLTSTALRYSQLTPDPVAVIVSAQRKILFWAVSSSLREIRGIFLEKKSPVPPASTTYRFSGDPQNVAQAREDEGITYLSAWFENTTVDIEFSEDVIGLGAYGRTLTILHADEVPDPEYDDEEDDPDHFTPDGKRYRW